MSAAGTKGPSSPALPTELRAHVALVSETKVRIVVALTSLPVSLSLLDPATLPSEGSEIVDIHGGCWFCWELDFADLNRMLRQATFELSQAPLSFQHAPEVAKKHLRLGLAWALGCVLRHARGNS